MLRKLFLDYLSNRIGEFGRYLKVLPTGQCTYTYSHDTCVIYRKELELQCSLLKQSTIYKLGKLDTSAPILRLLTDRIFESGDEINSSAEDLISSLSKYMKEDNIFIESYLHVEKEIIDGKIYYDTYTYRCIHVFRVGKYITIIPYLCTNIGGKIDVMDFYDFKIILNTDTNERNIMYTGLSDFNVLYPRYRQQLDTFFMFYAGFLKLISCKNVIARATEIKVSKKKKRKGYIPEYFYTLGFTFNRSEVENCSLRIDRNTAMVTFSDVNYITGGFKTNENGELYWVQEIGEEND